MGIEDEIRAARNNYVSNQKEQLFIQQEQKKLREEISRNDMTIDSPVIMMPPSELREIIIETMPYMTFNQPKIIKTMSNNETMIRFARKSEEPDAFSFDVQLCPVKSLFPCDEYGGSFSYDYLWIFMNGAISVAEIAFKKEELFSNDRIIYYDTFDVKLPRRSKHLSLIDGSVEEIRRKIIDKIATINS